MRAARTLAWAALLLAPTQAAAQSAAELAPRSKGRADAPVTVYEMSDFQCPYCRRHALEAFPVLEREYVATGKVRWVFVNFPLAEIHPNAAAAAELAMCGAEQGKFWPLHDLLFEHQERWAKLEQPTGYFLGLADSAKVDRAAMTACLRAGRGRTVVEADAAGARRAGARSTPTFYIEGGLLRGAFPPEVFRPVLDSVIAARTGRPPTPTPHP